MGNTLKIILNDAETIKEVAKDPEVVKEIKKAIIDGVAKRVAKAIEGDIKDAIKNEIRKFTHPDKANAVFKNYCWGDVALSDKMCNQVETIVKCKVQKEIDEIIEKFDVNKQYIDTFNRRKEEIEKYDFDAAVQKFIMSKLASSFGKLMMK